MTPVQEGEGGVGGGEAEEERQVEVKGDVQARGLNFGASSA